MGETLLKVFCSDFYELVLDCLRRTAICKYKELFSHTMSLKNLLEMLTLFFCHNKICKMKIKLFPWGWNTTPPCPSLSHVRSVMIYTVLRARIIFLK